MAGPNWSSNSGGGSGGTPGGADTNVQYNDGSAFGGDANLTWNKTTQVLTIAGAVTAPLVVTTGTIPTTKNAFSLSTTLSAAAGNVTGFNYPIATTGAGSGTNITGQDITIAAGSTTTGRSIGLNITNNLSPSTAGGVDWLSSSGNPVNMPLKTAARGTGALGTNMSIYADCDCTAKFNLGVTAQLYSAPDTAAFKGAAIAALLQYPSATPTNYRGVAIWASIDTNVGNQRDTGDMPAVTAVIYSNNGGTTADILRCDDNGSAAFRILDGGAIATNQTAAATIPANVVAKMPVYDATSALVGYVAIYDAIV